MLVVAWLLGALRAGGPYPVLAIAGEQGSAKTVLSKLLRALIDPSVAPVRALPRDERELFIAASNGHVLAFDNLSGLPPWLSDTLCRLTSGGAFSTRRLFTDQDEILFAAARPIILNGIEEVITRPDLADRAILLMLAPIAERQRRPETALWREFELARPRILGALLDAAAHGLQMLPQVRLQRLPRMADFALWVAACETGFRPEGAFEAAYSNNRRDAIENIVDADPVAARVRELMADRAQWTGSASDLLQVGINVGGNTMAAWTRSGWPKSPRALAGRLRRAQTSLRALGIEIVFGREGRLGTRTIRITAIGEHQSGNTVSTVSRVSDKVDMAGSKTSSARTGTGALIAQTLLTVLTQNSRLCSGEETTAASVAAAAGRRLPFSSSSFRSRFQACDSATFLMRSRGVTASDRCRCDRGNGNRSILRSGPAECRRRRGARLSTLPADYACANRG